METRLLPDLDLAPIEPGPADDGERLELQPKVPLRSAERTRPSGENPVPAG